MPFKSSIQPLCRGCGKPIAKRTRPVFFGQTGSGTAFDNGSSRREKPRTREEAQRFFNETILSLTWFRCWRGGERLPQEDYISRVSLWDGESYDDEFFHSVTCAAKLGRAAARQDIVMPAYNAAIRKQTP